MIHLALFQVSLFIIFTLSRPDCIAVVEIEEFLSEDEPALDHEKDDDNEEQGHAESGKTFPFTVH